ncbi:MAG: HAD family phosphatase [Gammaproteobacteria bacterium]|nr:HAD family phosphatase [Gammaproteobacteria bacterium]MDH5653277.1 HAD family phosphatase [Gammaproteobacteria bacterium]
MSAIKNIVFDVGRVLIGVDYCRLYDFIQQHGVILASEDEFIRRTDMSAYERGLIDTDCFLANLARLFPTAPSTAELAAAWLDIFTPIDAMLQLCRQLKGPYRIYLLSNTNPLHWQHVVPTYRLEQCCHGLLTSFDSGLMKPDPAIYHTAEQHFGIMPHETLFIDDIKENIHGAAVCGWSTIHHISVEQTRSELSHFGVVL